MMCLKLTDLTEMDWPGFEPGASPEPGEHSTRLSYQPITFLELMISYKKIMLFEFYFSSSENLSLKNENLFL